MKPRSNLPLLLLAALVMALSYLGGALAPPLHRAGAAGPAAPDVTLAEWETLQVATDLLLPIDDADGLYLPLIVR